MHSYTRPERIPGDMGGRGDVLDARLAEVLAAVEEAPLRDATTVLDVGAGRGQISRWLAQQGKQVTATGVHLESYDINAEELAREGVRLEECPVEKMPFADGAFDAVLLSHVLEHCPNVEVALREVRRVLRDGGLLMVFVPPHDDYVSAGHLSMGWNVGQLLYVLVHAGFDVASGVFCATRHNVVAFVRKRAAMVLPVLRGDRGDIRLLADAGLLPLPIVSRDGLRDGFLGCVPAINCDARLTSKLVRRSPAPERIAAACARACPSRLRTQLSRVFLTVGRIFAGGSTGVNARSLFG